MVGYEAQLYTLCPNKTEEKWFLLQNPKTGLGILPQVSILWFYLFFGGVGIVCQERVNLIIHVSNYKNFADLLWLQGT